MTEFKPSGHAKITGILAAALLATAVMWGAAPAPALAVSYFYVRTIGHSGLGPGEFINPRDVAVTEDQKVVVASFQSLEVFDRVGTYLTRYTSFHGTSLDQPSGIDMDPRTGDIYVGNRLADTIHRLDRNFTWLNDCGSTSAHPGDPGFADVGGVAYGGRDQIFGTDHARTRVGAYDFDGLAGSFMSFGTSGSDPGQFTGPSKIDFDDDGLCYVTDYTRGKVMVFKPAGQFLREWSIPNDGISIDAAGNVYVAEASAQPRVVRFDQLGNRLDDFGPNGSVDTSWFGSIDAVRDDGHRNILVLDSGRGHVREMAATVPTTYTAAAGAGRYETSVKVSQASYPYGLMVSDPEGWSTVVVASGANWPDALGAAPLAGAYRAPILLVRKDSVPSVVAAEIQRLGAGRVFLVGGTSAVSNEVVTQLSAIPGIGGRVVRISGTTRYETSRLCAQMAMTQARPLKWAFVTTGADFPDALAASPVAYAKRGGVYLCARDSTAIAGQLMADGVNRVVILGGPNAVTAATEAAIKVWYDPSFVQRWAGTDRYDTAVQVTANATVPVYGGSNLGRLAIATGTDFPDALGGGPAVGRNNGTLVLTRPGALPPPVASLLGANSMSVYRVWFLGGTGAVSNAVRTTVRGLLY